MKTVRIIHTGDFHISQTSQVKITRIVKKETTPINVRTIDIFQKINKVIDFAVEKKAHIFIITGDVFQTHNQPLFLQRWLARCLKRLIDKNIYVIVLVGNHDTNGDVNPFVMLKGLSSKGLYVMDEPGTIPIKIEDNMYYFQVIPFLPPNSKNNIHEWLATHRENRRLLDSKRNILVAHFGVNGAVGPNDLIMNDNNGVKEDELRGWDYVALGDYHKNQKIGVNPRIRKANEIWYCGSLQRHDMAEPEKKYFNYVIFHDKGLPEVQRILMSDRQYLKMKLNYIQALKFKFISDNVKIKKGSIINIIIRCTKEQEIKFPEKAFRNVLEKIYKVKYLIIDYDIIKQKKNRIKKIEQIDDEQIIRNHIMKHNTKINIEKIMKSFKYIKEKSEENV